MKDAETKIASLETTIDGYEKALTSGQPQLHFAQRMDRLFLLNGAMVAFEAYNLASVANRLMSDFGNTRARIDMASALTDFAATIATSYQYVFESRYGTTKQISSRLKDIAKEEFVRSWPVNEQIKHKSIRLNRMVTVFNVMSGTLSSLLSSIDAYNRWVLGDKDAAIAYGMTAVGFALTAVAALSSLSTAALLTMNIAGFALIAIGFVLVYFWTDTPTETLLKNSPFSREVESRFGGSGFMQDESYQYWSNRRDLAYHECASFFLQPRVQFSETWVEHEEFCELITQTPGLMANGTYHIEVQAWHSENKQWETITLLSNDPNTRVSAHPGNIQIKADGFTHIIRIHRDLIKSFGVKPSFGIGYASTETKIRVRVKTYPKGEASRLFPGAITPFVLPAPMRNELGQAVIGESVVDERTAAENAWLVSEGAVVHSFRVVVSPT